MEKTFNKIVLSHTEPNVEDLWMRINIEKTPNGEAIHGHSLWWFTDKGWKKLFDFDTRYSVTTDYDFSKSNKPYDSKSEYNPEIGIVSVSETYYLYDATRALENSANLVTEKGLKYHVDVLTEKIETEVEERKRDIARINGEIGTIERNLSSLEGRISNLESNVQ